MSYLVTIILQKIRYSGLNIGNDMNFRFNIDGKITEFNANISVGKSRIFNRTIFQCSSTGNHVQLPISTEVIEKDPVFNDVGKAKNKLKVNLDPSETSHTMEVLVRGDELGDQGKQAKLTFNFKVIVESAVRFIADVWPNGWVKVRLENGFIHPLPYQLKVELFKRENKREYFIIREGKLKGKKASVRLKSKKTSYLMKNGKRKGPARLSYDRTARNLKITGLGEYSAVMDVNPLTPGEYDIEIPFEPHPGGNHYTRYSKYSKTWFRIGHSGDRFLHIGRASLGCITVKSYKHWTKIYQFLIQSRLDKRSIGTISIK